MADFIPRLSNCKDFTFHQSIIQQPSSQQLNILNGFQLLSETSFENPRNMVSLHSSFLVFHHGSWYHEFSQTSHHQIIRREINVSRQGFISPLPPPSTSMPVGIKSIMHSSLAVSVSFLLSSSYHPRQFSLNIISIWLRLLLTDCVWVFGDN